MFMQSDKLKQPQYFRFPNRWMAPRCWLDNPSTVGVLQTWFLLHTRRRKLQASYQHCTEMSTEITCDSLRHSFLLWFMRHSFLLWFSRNEWRMRGAISHHQSLPFGYMTSRYCKEMKRWIEVQRSEVVFHSLNAGGHICGLKLILISYVVHAEDHVCDWRTAIVIWTSLPTLLTSQLQHRTYKQCYDYIQAVHSRPDVATSRRQLWWFWFGRWIWPFWWSWVPLPNWFSLPWFWHLKWDWLGEILFRRVY